MVWKTNTCLLLPVEPVHHTNTILVTRSQDFWLQCCVERERRERLPVCVRCGAAPSSQCGYTGVRRVLHMQAVEGAARRLALSHHPHSSMCQGSVPPQRRRYWQTDNSYQLTDSTDKDSCLFHPFLILYESKYLSNKSKRYLVILRVGL